MTETPPPPNTGRIIDYWFGGSNHTPADVGAGNALAGMFPGFPTFFAACRAFSTRAVEFVRAQGVEQFLVVGAGIPDSNNVHQVVPGARVLYSDVDEYNVQLGRKLIADVDGVSYVHFDAGDLSTYKPELERGIIDPNAPLAVVMCGVTAFLTDQQLRAFHEWAGERAASGSFLIFDFDTHVSEELPEVVAVMRASGPYHPRDNQGFAALLGPWRPTEDGIVPINEWRNPTPEDVRPYFAGGVARKS